MRILNRVCRLAVGSAGTWLERLGAPFAAALGPGAYPLRFSIVAAGSREIVIEATVVYYEPDDPYASRLAAIEILEPRDRGAPRSPFTAVQIVPTGVRCEVGGYAGDATPVTNLLAAAVDVLVTHPNAVNASELNEMAENVLYVEGKSLDDFLLGHIGLAPVRANRIGTFVDPTGADYLGHVIDTLNAAIAVAGIACEPYLVLGEELGVRIEWSETGCAVGTVLHPEIILDAVGRMIAGGVEAIGGVSVIHGVTAEMFAKHLRGEIPNPSGGVEAIITHLISKIFRVPTAHAPLPYYQSIKEIGTFNPRASAEFISTPHYYCVLKGLSAAPRLAAISQLQSAPPELITANNVGAVIMPASCLGGIPALAAEYHGIPVIAVRENATVLHVTNETMRMPNVIVAASYLEAAGLLLALRTGLSPASVRRPLAGAMPFAAAPA
jgi:hypothetical protein